MNRQNDLWRMYGATPESFKRRVSLALKETEEQHVKKLTLRTVLIAAAILALLMAAGYAAFSSQVTAFFGKLYGAETQEWLEKGDVATSHQSLTMADVVFTVDEVVYRNNGLYGVGTIRPREGSNVVLLPQNHTPDEPYGYDVYGEGGTPERVPSTAPTFGEVAMEKGAKLLMVHTIPEKIGVDGGELLTPGNLGFAYVPQRDGSIRFSFEVSDGYVVGEGKTYTLLMYGAVSEISPRGDSLESTSYRDHWTVEVRPTPIRTQTKDEPSVSARPIKPDALTAPEIIVPDEYAQTGTLAIYRATARDFGRSLQPELFNRSGIAGRDDYTIFFTDGSLLDWRPSVLFYGEYTSVATAADEKPNHLNLRPALSTEIFNLAELIRRGMLGEEAACGAEKTALEMITQDEAKATLEALLAQLNVEGYSCDFALEMSKETVEAYVERQSELIAAGELYVHEPLLDFREITPLDEGYYLSYRKYSGDRDRNPHNSNLRYQSNENEFSVYAFVTARGVVNVRIHDAYFPGEVYSTPEKLIEPRTVLNSLPKEIAASRYPENHVSALLSISLTYQPIRAADKTDGMVFSPVWQIFYQDENAVREGYHCWAEFDAVNGDLLNAIFK